MTTTPPPHDDDAARSGPGSDDRDRLIDRVASGDLTGQAWGAFSQHAGEETAAWRTMAESLRDQLMLIDAAVAAADVADRVELPAPPAAPAVHPAGRRAARPAAVPDRGAHRTLARARGAAGWMVSAMLLLVLVTLSPMLVPGSRGETTTARQVPPTVPAPDASASILPANLSASDALSLYLARGRDEGRVVEEQPELVMVESRPAAGGEGYEVLYVRQILERAVVPELYVPSGRDAEGRPVLTRVARRERPAF